MKSTVIVASLLMLLGGCVVAPAPVRVAPPPRVAYVPPAYAIPGPGYVWAHHPQYGWGWHHPTYGWHKGWR